MKGILKYDFKFSPVFPSQPLWRNGLAHWTSNSKVVGSSPTRGVVFFLFFFFSLTFCSVRIPPHYSWLRFLFFKIKKTKEIIKPNHCFWKQPRSQGSLLLVPLNEVVLKAAWHRKRDAIRRLHALRNLNQLKQTILYSIPFYYYYYYYFARFCPRSINSFPVSSHFIGFSSIKNEFYIHSRVVFAVFDYLQKWKKILLSLFLYSLSGIKAAFLHRKKKHNRSNIYKNIRCIISFLSFFLTIKNV